MNNGKAASRKREREREPFYFNLFACSIRRYQLAAVPASIKCALKFRSPAGYLVLMI